MDKTVWILNHYAGETFFDKGGRHYSIAKYLKRIGFEPMIFCSNAMHGRKETYIKSDSLFTIRVAEEIQTPYVFVKNRLYDTNGKDRIINMVDFYYNLIRTCRLYAKKNGAPALIYASSVHPLTLVAGIKLAKRFGIKCVSEVRDLWPESIVEYSDKLSKNNPIIRLFYQGEKWIYKNSNAIVFTFEGGYDYIKEKGWATEIPESKVFYINNGVDIESFNYNKENYCIVDEDLENEKKINIVYTGSIRKVNNLGRLLDIALLVKNPNVRFLIYGDGNELDYLKTRVRTEQISNVIFKGRIGKQYIPYITSKAYANIAHNNPSDLYRFGISFNKIFEYMAAGKPVFVDFDSKYNPIKTFNAGIIPDSFDNTTIAQAIDDMCAMNTTIYEAACKKAKKASEKYSYDTLTKRLAEVFMTIA